MEEALTIILAWSATAAICGLIYLGYRFALCRVTDWLDVKPSHE